MFGAYLGGCFANICLHTSFCCCFSMGQIAALLCNVHPVYTFHSSYIIVLWPFYAMALTRAAGHVLATAGGPSAGKGALPIQSAVLVTVCVTSTGVSIGWQMVSISTCLHLPAADLLYLILQGISKISWISGYLSRRWETRPCSSWGAHLRRRGTLLLLQLRCLHWSSVATTS